MAEDIEVQIPYNFTLRDYQVPAWAALESGCTRIVLLWHRRCGKDLFSFNWLVTQIIERPGLYWHCSPFIKQGRKLMWEGYDKNGRRFLDYIPGGVPGRHDQPGSIVERSRNDEMSLLFHNGAKFQCVGADDPSSLVGPNPFGIIFSEWAVYKNDDIWTFLRPILLENDGWAIWPYTPRGYNHGHTLFEMAKNQMAKSKKRWFVQKLTMDDTRIVTEEQIQGERDEGMEESKVQQEYFCSFTAPTVGAFYGDQMVAMTADPDPELHRICSVPHDPALPVTTYWDLGVRHALVIWFAQQHRREHRLIDFEWYSGSDSDLAKIVKKLNAKPYVYDIDLLPHDAAVREMTAPGARSRMQTLRSLGRKCRIVPKLTRDDGIQAVKELLGITWIDEEHCQTGINGLKQYARKKLEMKGPSGEQLYGTEPIEDWCCDVADALRTGAVGRHEPRAPGPAQKLAPDLSIV